MFIEGVGEVRSFLDGRSFLEGAPFRSGYFVITSVVGMGALLGDAYLVYRCWPMRNGLAVLGLAGLIAIQIIYQWWRIWRYYAVIRKLYSRKRLAEAEDGTALDAALRIAAGGLIDILFYSYGMVIVALAIIGLLLMRLQKP